MFCSPTADSSAPAAAGRPSPLGEPTTIAQAAALAGHNDCGRNWTSARWGVLHRCSRRVTNGR